jgi:hypothetical protein
VDLITKYNITYVLAYLTIHIILSASRNEIRSTYMVVVVDHAVVEVTGSMGKKTNR